MKAASTGTSNNDTRQLLAAADGIKLMMKCVVELGRGGTACQASECAQCAACHRPSFLTNDNSKQF
jgi:hypothetical protein